MTRHEVHCSSFSNLVVLSCSGYDMCCETVGLGNYCKELRELEVVPFFVSPGIGKSEGTRDVIPLDVRGYNRQNCGKNILGNVFQKCKINRL